MNDLVAENLVFHGIIADATGMPRLKKMVDQVMVIPKRYRAYAAYVPEHRATITRDHRAIADAIRAREGDTASRLMEQHVRWTGDVAAAAGTFDSSRGRSQ